MAKGNRPSARERRRLAEEAKRKQEAARKAAEERELRERIERRRREEEREKEMKKPVQGKSVQQRFIDEIKDRLNIDLSKARDKQFDTKSTFNVDVRKLGNNDMAEIRRYLARYNGELHGTDYYGRYYKVELVDNGAYRIGIQVKYMKPKK